MKPQYTFAWLAALIASLPLSTTHIQAEAAKPIPSSITADEMKLADKHSVLPLPGEILSVMKDLEAADWAAAADAALNSPAPEGKMDSLKSAARLGMRTADAFLAIEAKNSALLDKAAAEILEDAIKLGASKEMLSSGEQIKDKAAAGKWVDIVPLLDRTYSRAYDAMCELGDTDSAAIAATTGWLRGLDIFAGQLAAKYSEQPSRALRQGALVGDLLTKLDALSAGTRSKPQVKALVDALNTIKPLVTIAREASVPQEVVKQIGAAAKTALAAQN